MLAAICWVCSKRDHVYNVVAHEVQRNKFRPAGWRGRYMRNLTQCAKRRSGTVSVPYHYGRAQHCHRHFCHFARAMAGPMLERIAKTMRPREKSFIRPISRSISNSGTAPRCEWRQRSGNVRKYTFVTSKIAFLPLAFPGNIFSRSNV